MYGRTRGIDGNRWQLTATKVRIGNPYFLLPACFSALRLQILLGASVLGRSTANYTVNTGGLRYAGVLYFLPLVLEPILEFFGLSMAF